MRPRFLVPALVALTPLLGCPFTPKAGTLLESTAVTAVVTRDGIQYLRTEVTVTNVDTRPVPLDYSGCLLRLHLFTTEARTGTPAWRSEAVEGCSTARNTQNVQPGTRFRPDPVVYERRVAVVLGDSLPDGEYHFRTIMPFTNRPSLIMSSGSAQLSR